MADKKKMSVEEILAACRQAGGADETGSAPAKSDEASQSSEPSRQSEEAAAKPKATSAKAGSMSVDDILAAARSGKTGADKGPSGPTKKAVSDKPAAAAKSGGKPDGMSIDDILAAARSGKAAGASKKAAAPKKDTPKPATKPKTTATAKGSTPDAGGPTDTSSILAAARKPVRRGPMSKTEAAARGQAVESTPEARDSKAKPKAAPRTAPPMPKKPEYAKAKGTSKEAANRNRRGFLVVLVGSFLAIGFTALSSVFGLFALGAARFMFPNILIEPPSRFKVGFPGDFAAGMVETKFKALYGIWVVNTEYDGQSQIVALKSVCTHLGCTPNWLEAEQKFKCPCHGSGFYKDGVNFEGPAPRPLERYAIQLADDGQLEVDKSSTFQEEMGQWRDPACFVPV